ncbi:hypothetical protein D6C83_04818 [Aureobasidium pullulans]|uniref:Uncharacterized protein n=1 Tax=Aureobasidium pullulans TaxID=5580 RepID=A0A4T0CNW6_AURPU|nr:hypothetical protein D6C83_04818 [Aureobasidium pullulans]
MLFKFENMVSRPKCLTGPTCYPALITLRSRRAYRDNVPHVFSQPNTSLHLIFSASGLFDSTIAHLIPRMKIVLCSLFLAALSYRVDAKLHNSAVCVTGRTEAPIGGTGWSVSYNWQKNYEIDLKATECACGYYKQRNTGDNQWDKCEDCTYDGLQCNSAGWHIGGDEVRKESAQGSRNQGCC